jgi:hypothetical protein
MKYDTIHDFNKLQGIQYFDTIEEYKTLIQQLQAAADDTNCL